MSHEAVPPQGRTAICWVANGEAAYCCTPSPARRGNATVFEATANSPDNSDFHCKTRRVLHSRQIARRPHRRRCCRRRNARAAAIRPAAPTPKRSRAATADINQCPPGGAEGVARARRAARHAGRCRSIPANGSEAAARASRSSTRALCIGCTICIQACPVDAIVGAAKRMHTVIAAHCTGCELCVPPCPVDCIALVAIDAGAARAGMPGACSKRDAARARATTAAHTPAPREARERARLRRDSRRPDASGEAARMTPAAAARSASGRSSTRAMARATRYRATADEAASKHDVEALLQRLCAAPIRIRPPSSNTRRRSSCWSR